jgi:hypothetical protein
MAVIPNLGGSFKPATSFSFTPRLVCAIDGLEKGGKTNFALTMPGPIAYQSFDIGLEGVIEKFQATKEIFLAEYSLKIDKDSDPKKVVEKVEPEWNRFVKDYKDVMLPGMRTGKIRSGVWDTGSEIWEAIRLARLGKLTQVMPHHYTALNMEFQNLVREVFDTTGNMCILHKLKAEWKDNPSTGKGNKTGNYERAGYSGMGFLVQVNATAWRDPFTNVFHLTVKDCRQNPKVAGLDLEGDQCTFPWLAIAVFPQTTLEDWGHVWA